MIEQDYPHIDSTWPRTQQLTVEALAGMPADDVRRITWQNASELYRFPVPQCGPGGPECLLIASPSSPAPAGASARASPSSSAPAAPPSTSPAAPSTPVRLPGTVGETAAEIDALGGRGIAVACDHHDDDQVKAVFDRIAAEQGRLDVLVNNVYSAPDLVPWLDKKYWELPIEAWDQVIDIGTRSHYVASVFGTPLLLASGGGLIVNVSSSGAVTYAHNVVYGVGKAAVDKMTADMAVELEGTGVTVVSLWPGLVRTELLEMGAQHDGDQTYIELPGEGRFDLSGAESPRFLGRAVVALADDPDLASRSGKAVRLRGAGP